MNQYGWPTKWKERKGEDRRYGRHQKRKGHPWTRDGSLRALEVIINKAFKKKTMTHCDAKTKMVSNTRQSTRTMLILSQLTRTQRTGQYPDGSQETEIVLSILYLIDFNSNPLTCRLQRWYLTIYIKLLMSNVLIRSSLRGLFGNQIFWKIS